MKIIYNNFLPPKGFIAIMLFGVIFARKEYHPISARTINHERIHKMQAKRVHGFVFFYLIYFVLWIKYGYWSHPYEVEARNHEHDPNYLKS